MDDRDEMNVLHDGPEWNGQTGGEQHPKRAMRMAPVNASTTKLSGPRRTGDTPMRFSMGRYTAFSLLTFLILVVAVLWFVIRPMYLSA
jgi:hypothetical protein